MTENKMMGEGKDEEKLRGPLFPRLHIKDAEQGGPRAPPRNKMALYEQLSIPSHKLTSGSASMSPPFPPINSGNLAHSSSSSHGGGQKRSLYSPIRNSPAASHLSERLHAYSSDGMDLNTTSTSHEWKPMKPTKNHSLNAAGHLSMTTNCSLFQPRSIANSRNSSAKELPDEVDCKVRTSVQLGKAPNCGNVQINMDKENLNASSPNRETQVACVKKLKQTSTVDLMSIQQVKNQNEENSSTSPSFHDRAKRPASILTNADKVLADASSSLLARGRISESVMGAMVPLNEEKRSILVDDARGLHDSSTQLHHENRASEDKKDLRDGISADPQKAVRKRNASILERVSCFRPTPGDNYKNPNRLESVSECHEDRCGPLQMGELDRNADASEKSIVDSISGVEISPDDVVGVMGQKQFLEARRAIVHQQRVFVAQVFELHRLIKVQRLFAASPDLLLDSKLYLGKPSIKELPDKKLLSDNMLEAPPLFGKLKDGPRKLESTAECAAENAPRKPPFPSLSGHSDIKLHTQQPNYKLSSTSTDAKPPPCFFHPPPGNQWLVPVMSPSEGLVYKPYTLPCPPTSGFGVPVYGISASQQQGIGIFPGTPPLGHTYIPPYTIPPMNLPVSSSTVELELASQVSKAQSNGMENHLTAMPCQSSSNFTSRTSGLNLNRVRNLQSDVQGSSTASGPERRLQVGDELPLFPTDPTVMVSDQPSQSCSTEQRTRVIKVVPHNPRSASESAARIFRSIQEERRQYT